MENTTHSRNSYQYQSFLVRLWQDDRDAPWRVSVKHVATGKLRLFDSLESFFIYLQTQTETAVDHQQSIFQNLSD